MKKSVLPAALLLAIVCTAGAQTSAGAVNGMTFNGSTGLIVVPDARIAWENANFGVDIGYGFVWTGGQAFDHLPRFAVSIAKRAEIHGLFQFNNSDLRNFVLGGKFQLSRSGGSALALGADLEMANQAAGTQISSKIYLAATYAGNFFDAPSVTTATIGWQMFENGNFSSQFIYGMGFSMSLLPKTFQNHVFWITDFANFSYTVWASQIDLDRGAFNTGVRIRPIKEGRFNLVIDILGTDLLDPDRGLGVNISGGLAF